MLGWFFLDILIGVWAKEYGPPHIEVNWITPTADGDREVMIPANKATEVSL